MSTGVYTNLAQADLTVRETEEQGKATDDLMYLARSARYNYIANQLTDKGRGNQRTVSSHRALRKGIIGLLQRCEVEFKLCGGYRLVSQLEFWKGIGSSFE